MSSRTVAIQPLEAATSIKPRANGVRVLIAIAAGRRRHVYGARAGRRRSPGERRERSQELADLFRRLFQQPFQQPDPDLARQCEKSRAEMDVPGGSRRCVADHAACRRRRHVSHAATQRRRRARRKDRPRVLDLSAHPRPDADRLLRREQSRSRRSSATRSSWARSTRISSRSTRRPDTPLWNTKVAESKGGYSVTHAPLVVKDKVIVGVGGGEYGIRGFVAAFDARSGREVWRFYTIPAPNEPGGDSWKPCPPKTADSFCDPEAWKHGGGSVWVTGSYDPATESHLLGRRQRRTRLEQRATSRRQPLYRFGRRARRRHRPTEVALPVHAERSVRLRLCAGPGPRRHHVARRAAEGDGLGEPQRQLLRARSRDRQVPRRQAVRQGELDGHIRRAWPSQPDAAAGGAADFPGNQGGTNWYSPSYSPHTGLFYVSAWEGYATISAARRSSIRKAEFRRRRESSIRDPFPAHPRCRAFAAARSTTGPKQRQPERCWRSMPAPAS